MRRKTHISRWFVGTLLLAGLTVLTLPAEAQRARSGGFFQDLFGAPSYRPLESEPAPQIDYSRAPSPRKPDPRAEPIVPTTSIVVMGDGMADWLAYGLEDAFSD